MHRSRRRISTPLSILAALTALGTTSCITREIAESVYDRERVEVILVEHKRGFSVIEREFSHPARISEQRIAHILGALEIRGREEELAGVRYVFEPEQLPAVASALAFGLGRANANQSVAIRLTAKVVQHAVFDRRHITSFIAYVYDDLLYVHVSRVDWKVPDLAKKTDPPMPRVDEHPMKFKVIPGKGMYAEGVYAVSVDWKSPLFSQPMRRASADGKGERTILLEDVRTEPLRPGVPGDTLSNLTAEELRELADLEEARQNGSLTEGHYRRARQKILDGASKRSGASD
jgi:hypothetical protein